MPGPLLILRGKRKGLCTWTKVNKAWWFCSMSKTEGRRGASAEDLQRCISPGRRTSAVQETCSSLYSGVVQLQLSIYLSIFLHLFIYLSFCLSVCLSIYLSIDRSISLCKFENEAILRDFLIFWTWQHQKRSNSARIPQLFNLTTSKTKQFCQTFSIFEVGNIKNEAILRDFLQKWKVECRADGLIPKRFAIFPLHLSKVLHLSRKIIFPKLKIWCSKMQPLSGNQRPDLLKPTTTTTLPLQLQLHFSYKNHSYNHSYNFNYTSTTTISTTFTTTTITSATTTATTTTTTHNCNCNYSCDYNYNSYGWYI